MEFRFSEKPKQNKTKKKQQQQQPGNLVGKALDTMYKIEPTSYAIPDSILHKFYGVECLVGILKKRWT